MFSRLLRHPVWKWSGTILVEQEGMKSKKTNEAWIRKGKNEKILKDREEGGEVGKWWDKGGLSRAHTGHPHSGRVAIAASMNAAGVNL